MGSQVPAAAPLAVAAVEQAIEGVCAEYGFRPRQLNDPELLLLIGSNAINNLPNDTQQAHRWSERSVWCALGQMIPLR